jgi:hypothetical protein
MPNPVTTLAREIFLLVDKEKRKKKEKIARNARSYRSCMPNSTTP